LDLSGVSEDSFSVVFVGFLPSRYRVSSVWRLGRGNTQGFEETQLR